MIADVSRRIDMKDKIELHDAKIKAISWNGTALCFMMDAYVHRWEKVDGEWKGTGWMQPVQICLSGATLTATPKTPVLLCGGCLRTRQTTYDNMVTLPLMSTEPVDLRLALATADVIDVHARDVSITPVGLGRYVEQLPDDFKPKENG